MSTESTTALADGLTPTEEARRQIEICNACRYCEGYCAVFPAITKQKAFADGDITQLANLCHNCRGCYYACQYTEPHEFALNLPKVLAEVRQESWQDHAWPQGVARAFHRSGVAIAAFVILGFALMFAAARWLGSSGGEGFYAVLSHNMMVAIFLPAFVLPLLSITISMRKFWHHIGGKPIGVRASLAALKDAARMKNLSGGHGEGCNFEDEDHFTQLRRVGHQLTMWGFLLCFAATSSGTVMHYLFDMPAPYTFFSLPKLLGVSGGIMLALGTAKLAWLKPKGNKNLGDTRVWGGEMAFVLLLFVVAVTGLALYWAGGTGLMPSLLALHLGAVLAFFLLMPFSKMVHGFYRLASLVRDAQQKEG
ncbi:tricarballylate utilization 4Fe-4S protein TcuB [Cochlodiniinecator piscidefendens]|uniref:tricarballylate utilization 4Fe-4S protein TcuB n=1 Tax=Cochlodiniinecator piscidefendens TaxID=2715756 RepID=UPI001409F62E|nr:tricarballylate utilization 4Fe-4S protein TcuB [Cochlodiniinecator piscidefendens]